MVPSLMRGLVTRFMPAKLTDGNYASLHTDGYGNMHNVPMYDGVVGSAEQGRFYVATNPTLDTAIVVTTSITTYAETSGAVGVALFMKNNVTPGDSVKRIVMSHIKLMNVTVPANATSWQYALVLDNSAVRYTSGGTVITPVNTNGDIASNSSIAKVIFGAITTAVPGTDKRYVGRGTFRGVVPTTFDEMSIHFGRFGSGSMASAAASGRQTCYNAPVVIPPGYNLALTMWGASNNAAPTFEFEVGWMEL